VGVAVGIGVAVAIGGGVVGAGPPPPGVAVGATPGQYLMAVPETVHVAVPYVIVQLHSPLSV